MTLITAIIIEDEYHSREALKNLIQVYCPSIQVVGCAASVDQGITLMSQHNPELVFLDIELSTESGFDFLNNVDQLNFEVIFTTAYEHYALKAIKFSAIDYLLKPIDFEELRLAVDKVVEKKKNVLYNKNLEILLNNLGNQNVKKHTITLSTAQGYQFINVSDILYCKAQGAYTLFHIRNKKPLLVSKHLKEYQNLLTEHDFLRVHQSYLINLAEVDSYVKSEGGYVIMKNGDHISVSTKNKDMFLKMMSRD